MRDTVCCHAGNVADPAFGKDHACSEFAQPALRLGEQVASPGHALLRGPDVSGRVPRRDFIAEHGSWNRSRKAGYRVVAVHVGKDGKVSGSQPSLTGFLGGQTTQGRPADVQPIRDGSLPVSDDDNDVIGHPWPCFPQLLRMELSSPEHADPQ